VFGKLGYVIDEDALARAYADEGDIVMSVDRAAFERAQGDAAAQVRIATR
jgi:hypothetical protein